ncbi:hypothetical protein BH11MYX3_BH11MYX3_21450 [soil metagenome]
MRTFSAALLVMIGACTDPMQPTDDLDQGVGGEGSVRINEFVAGQSGKIELYNAGGAAVSLAGWRVDDVANGGYSTKALSGSIAPGAYLVVGYAGINTASADQVRLIDDLGVERDAHSNFYVGSSTAGLCFGRQGDGGAWASGALTCSLGASNGCTGESCGTDAGSGIELLAMPRRDRVVLQGVVVLPSGAFQGEVLVEGDTITCVGTSCGVIDAAVVQTHGLILPGLIDAHNHILFDIFDETHWSPIKAYANHNQWTNEARYKALVDAKQYLNGEGSPVSLGCEMDKYGELKALIAGTTSVQGSANPSDKACFASLARTIDQSGNGLGFDRMQTSTLFPSLTSASSVCANFDSGRTDAYLIHIGEGVDATSRDELAKLGTISSTPQCLYSPHTTIIHGTALGDPEMTTLATHGMSLVWSPRSNVFLYGAGTDLSKTTDVPLALSKGINVALAPDWSIGGSQNMLDELRFADHVDNVEWGDQLSPQQLFAMATINAARALGVEDVLGSIEVGKKADLMVIPGDLSTAYDSLLKATPADVRLVMVGGVALYGDPAVAPLGPSSPGCETIGVCAATKFACVAQAGGTAINKLGQSYAEIQSVLAGNLAAYDALDASPYNFSPITPLARCPL